MKKIILSIVISMSNFASDSYSIDLFGWKMGNNLAKHSLPCLGAFLATNIMGVTESMAVTAGICASNSTLVYLNTREKDINRQRIEDLRKELKSDVESSHDKMRRTYSKYRDVITTAIERVMESSLKSQKEDLRKYINEPAFKSRIGAIVARKISEMNIRTNSEMSQDEVDTIVERTYNKIIPVAMKKLSESQFLIEKTK